jgi:MYXO-CTERM domain-containing protein
MFALRETEAWTAGSLTAGVMLLAALAAALVWAVRRSRRG